MKLKKLVYLPALISLVIFFFYSSCKKDNLLDLQGIENDTTVCDTSFIVSYQNDIVPILRFSKKPSTTEPCYNCHTQATSGRGGGNVLDTYDNLKIYVDNDKLLCAIKRTGCADAKPMPDVGEKLSDCDIGRIEAWIIQGAPNN